MLKLCLFWKQFMNDLLTKFLYKKLKDIYG